MMQRALFIIIIIGSFMQVYAKTTVDKKSTNSISNTYFYNYVDDSVELAALKDFYYSLDGPNWFNLYNDKWLQGDNPDNFYNWDYLEINNGDVWSMHFEYVGLKGAIPESITKLTNLYILKIEFEDLDEFPIFLKEIPYLSIISFQSSLASYSKSLPSLKEFPYLTDLNISYNYLVGDFPELPSGNTLTNIKAERNNFTSMPDFSNYNDYRFIELDFSYNDLDFADLEPYFDEQGNHPFAVFNYSPQNTVYTPIVEYRPLNDTVSLTASPSQYSIYQWQKRTSGYSWIDISGATDSTLSIVLDDNDSYGVFRCKITNSRVPDLTIFTQPRDIRKQLEPINTPTDFIIKSISSSQNQLNWTDVSENEAGFIIYRRSGITMDFITVDTVLSNSNQYVDEGLLSNTYYEYKVLAFNYNEYTSAPTPIKQVTTQIRDFDKTTISLLSPADSTWIVKGDAVNVVTELSFDSPDHFPFIHIISTAGNYDRFQINYDPNNLWSKNYLDVTNGGLNDRMIMTMKDLSGTVDFTDVKMFDEIFVSEFMQGNEDTNNWFTVEFPLSAFSNTDFTAFAQLHYKNSAAPEYELAIKEIIFTGSGDPAYDFLFFGEAKSDNSLSDRTGLVASLAYEGVNLSTLELIVNGVVADTISNHPYQVNVSEFASGWNQIFTKATFTSNQVLRSDTVNIHVYFLDPALVSDQLQVQLGKNSYTNSEMIPIHVVLDTSNSSINYLRIQHPGGGYKKFGIRFDDDRYWSGSRVDVTQGGANSLMQVTLKDNNSSFDWYKIQIMNAIPISNYIPEGTNTSQWFNIEVPLNDFPNVDWTTFRHISLKNAAPPAYDISLSKILFKGTNAATNYLFFGDEKTNNSIDAGDAAFVYFIEQYIQELNTIELYVNEERKHEDVNASFEYNYYNQESGKYVIQAKAIMADNSVVISQPQEITIVLDPERKIYAIQSGNWHDPAVWNLSADGSGASVNPLPGDKVYIVGVNITLNQDQQSGNIFLGESNANNTSSLTIENGVLEVDGVIKLIKAADSANNPRFQVIENGKVVVRE